MQCDGWVYNVPKSELGLGPEKLRREDISVSMRYLVEERARFQCELCGQHAPGVVMHVGHLIARSDVVGYGLPVSFANHLDNLAWLCEECNLGMGRRSLPLHDLLVFLIRRQCAQEDRDATLKAAQAHG